MPVSVKNFYPELPILDYKKTSVEMGSVESYLKSLGISREIKIAAYVMFRNESGNGQSGVNNNYTGVQADDKRWPEYLNQHIVGTVIRTENLKKIPRRFCAFDNVNGNLDFLVDRVQKRGLYVGGSPTKFSSIYKITTPVDFAKAYWQSWVEGDANAVIPQGELKGLVSMYNSGLKVF